MEPPAPLVDVPVLNRSQPVLPEVDDPEPISTDPDTPREATDADANTTLPEPEDRLAPLVSEMEPPVPVPLALPASTVTAPPLAVADVVRPPRISNWPPVPEVPSPTIMEMLPP
jgi:hypothetical protein